MSVTTPSDAAGESLKPPVIPDHSRCSSSDHQDWKVPQRVVQDASSAAEENQDSGKFVCNGFL